MIRNSVRRSCFGSRGFRKRIAEAGFTMLELMVVIAIMFTLLAIASLSFRRSHLQAREAALKQDLRVMREAIDHYTLDKEAAPQSLDDLVAAGYLREVPPDPITRAKDWRVETSDVVMSPEQSSSGITDVHSNSNDVSSLGTPYSSW